ncbi:MAG: dockerin type I repeat-containing protein [Lachnospiraceae bacterium]|nr:dockerin type I repeat-containing protein [Lachnospiraceae bacterium]
MKNSIKVVAVCVMLFTAFCIITAMTYTKSYAYSTGVLGNVGELLSVCTSSDGNLNILSRLDGEFVSTRVFADGSYDSYATGIMDNDTLYSAGNDNFYFLTDNVDIQEDGVFNYACLTTLNCEDGYASTKAFNEINSNIIRSFAVDNRGYLYIANEREIRIYSPSAKYQDSIRTDRQPQYLTASQDGSQIFAVYDGTVGIIDGYDINLFPIDCDRVYHCNGYLATDTGEVYELNGSELTYVLTQDCNFGVGSSDGKILGSKDGGVTVFEQGVDATVTTELPTAIFSIESTCLCLFQNKNNIEIQFIYPGELSEAVEQKRRELDSENSNSSNITSSNGQNSSSKPNNASSKIEYYYRSSTLTFNENNKTLTGIQPSSTIAQIKSAIDYNGYKLSFTDHNGNNKTSGSIGTGGKLTFKGNGKIITFTVIVLGDVTGEGNINSLDKNALFNHLLGSKTLSGDYLTAADITENGTADLADLVALSNIM